MLSLKKKMLMAGGGRLRPQDVFATSLYTGNGGTQTITNGLDLAGKGGLVWGKGRSSALDHILADTVRGGTVGLKTNSTEREDGRSFQFNSNGFTLLNGDQPNTSGQTHVSWSFRRAKKFLDIVTYTGNGQSGRQIPHALGDVPGMIVVKARSAAGSWHVHHRSIHAQTWTGTKTGALVLNSTDANNLNLGVFGTVNATSFEVFRGNADINQPGTEYVAYLFAHNPDLIQCGSYTGNGQGAGPSVTLGTGWAPQFLGIKRTDAAGNWHIWDTSRGAESILFPNLSSAETTGGLRINPLTNSGFQIIRNGADYNAAGGNYAFWAIREPKL